MELTKAEGSGEPASRSGRHIGSCFPLSDMVASSKLFTIFDEKQLNEFTACLRDLQPSRTSLMTPGDFH